jgi:hypothetical protein
MTLRSFDFRRPEITAEDLQLFINFLRTRLKRFAARGRQYRSRAHYTSRIDEKERDKVQALLEKLEAIRQDMLAERLKEVVQPQPERVAPWRRDVIGRILDPD